MRRFLLVGRTGVGKSSFINAAFGQHIAKTSEFEACTKMIEYHAYSTHLGDICLIDTPGLAEDDELCDQAYLSLVREQVNFNQIYAIIYVTRLDETRFRPDEKRTLRLLTHWLGASIWNRSILVLTFAASIHSKRREEAALIRTEHIEEFIYDLTLEKKITPTFKRFRECWLTDNVVKNWTLDGLPIMSLLNK